MVLWKMVENSRGDLTGRNEDTWRHVFRVYWNPALPSQKLCCKHILLCTLSWCSPLAKPNGTRASNHRLRPFGCVVAVTEDWTPASGSLKKTRPNTKLFCLGRGTRTWETVGEGHHWSLDPVGFTNERKHGWHFSETWLSVSQAGLNPTL